MTDGDKRWVACAAREADVTGERGFSAAWWQPRLTLPLLCAVDGRWFQVGGGHQGQGGGARGHAVERGRQAAHVALLLALLVETVEEVGVEVDAEGAAATIAPVQRTGAPALRPVAGQAC